MSRTTVSAVARFGAALAFFGLVACTNEKPTAPSLDSASVTIGHFTNAPGDPLHRVESQIRGDELLLNVRYGGGCNEHRFALTGGGVFMESYPVQTALTLHHDALGDQCRALVGKSLRFDLTPLKRTYQRAYQTRAGVIVIHLTAPGSPRNHSASLRYVFEE